MRYVCWALGLAVAAGSGEAQGSRLWRPETRAVISDYSRVMAVAADDARVYVATERGLGIYDRRFRQWEPPVSLLDGYPRAPVRVALADPAGDAVWLATADGVARYRPAIRQWETVPVPGGALDLMMDRDDPFSGVYVRTRSGWELLRPGAPLLAPARELPPAGRRLQPLGPEELMARFPQTDALRADVLTDERLRTFRYTSAARVPRTEEVYLGTDGLGVIRYDAGIVRFERLPFGLLDAGAGAVALAPGGVWVGTDHRARRPGFTFVDDRLQRYEYEEGRAVTGFGFGGVRDLAVDGETVWAATDRGLVRFVAGRTDPPLVLGARDGLPDDDAYALARTTDGVWVGTAFGLAFVDADLAVERLGRGAPVPVLALAVQGDSVWAGTTAGLGLAVRGGDRLVVPPAVEAEPDLRAAIVALARRGDTLVAATVERLVWRTPADGWRSERIVAGEIGVVFALAAGDGGVWVGGGRGVGFFRFADRAFLVMLREGDLPGGVRDLAVSADYLWVATEGGLVRVLRRELEP